MLVVDSSGGIELTEMEHGHNHEDEEEITDQSGDKHSDKEYDPHIWVSLRNVKIMVDNIYASPQFSTASAQVIASEIGGKVVFIDPLEKDYIQNMRNVANALSEAME
jgi:zinc transport system substrate-binding protein